MDGQKNAAACTVPGCIACRTAMAGVLEDAFFAVNVDVDAIAVTCTCGALTDESLCRSQAQSLSLQVKRRKRTKH